MVDLDDRSKCPVDDHCATCGTSDDLAVATAGTQVGVHCITVCGSCEDAGNLPTLSFLAAFDLIADHCGHLGITLDEMAAAMES